MTEISHQRLMPQLTGKLNPRWLAYVLVIVAFALRIHHLDGDSLWVDEISTIPVANRGWEAMAGEATHPGLYFLITAGSITIFGESEFGLRIPSLFLSTITIATIYLAGRLLGRKSIGLWAALLLVFSPLHLRHTQEARMYAQLLLFSLLSFIALHEALKRPRLSLWTAYTVVTMLNLYTHYGALIVLSAQAILIALYCVDWLADRENRRRILWPLGSGLAIVVFYLPWLPRFIDSLYLNVGRDTVTHTGTRGSLLDWARVAYFDFGMYDELIAGVFLFLAFLVYPLWAYRRRWYEMAHLSAALLLPLPLIAIFQVARGPISRYIIFMLPIYLLAIAAVITEILGMVRQAFGRNSSHFVALTLAAGFVLVGWPAIKTEYLRVSEDWRGIVTYLDRESAKNSIVLTMAVNFTTGFNMVSHSLPYYLERSERSYTLVDGNKVTVDDALALNNRRDEVWAVVNRWPSELSFEGDTLPVSAFDNNLYVVQETNGKNSLDRVINFYERMLPMASSPVPRCLMHQDLSTFYLASQRPAMAIKYLEESRSLCPVEPAFNKIRPSLSQAIADEIELHDWSALVELLSRYAGEEDIVVGVDLSGREIDKPSIGILAEYFRERQLDYQVILIDLYHYDELESLDNRSQSIWYVLAADTTQIDVNTLTTQSTGLYEIQDGRYLLSRPARGNSPLESMVEFFQESLLPLVEDHEASCRLTGDLALIMLASGEYSELPRATSDVDTLCLGLESASFSQSRFRETFHRHLRDAFTKVTSDNSLEAGRILGNLLLQFDPKDESALELATADYLMNRFENGQVQIFQNGAPEPVRTMHYVMPHNGDWGDVIFIHPPASVSFDLVLPQDPVEFQTRLALDPQSWSWGGDGVTFVALLQVGSAEPIEILRQTVLNDDTGHDWVPARLDLAPYSGRSITLTLTTEPGPSGDFTGDWAGWESPRLVWK